MNPALELRREPDHRAECVTECVMGSRLRLHEEREEGRWLLVSAPDGYRAWARSWGCDAPVSGWPEAGVFVCEPAAAMRSAPRPDAASLVGLTLGCRLEARGPAAGGFRAVATPDRREGWIAETALEPDRLPARAGFWDPAPEGGLASPGAPAFAAASWELVRARAMSLLGAPYRWGGTTAAALDCSGLVRLALGLEGIVLPRDARDQAVALRGLFVAEDPARLAAGDLVFFGAVPEEADHVGLGIGPGAGIFLHASGRVRVSHLDAKDARYEAGLASRVCAIARPPWGR